MLLYCWVALKKTTRYKTINQSSGNLIVLLGSLLQVLARHKQDCQVWKAFS